MATHSRILAWRIPWTEAPSLWVCKESGTMKRLTLSINKVTAGFPGGSVVKESAYNAGDSPWGRETIRHNLMADERTTK